MQKHGLDAHKIGLRIAEIRAKSGKHIAAFARAIGAEAKTVTRVERGENVPSTPFVVACALEGHVSTDWVLFGTGRGPRKRRAA